jgi:hypothetical protein
VRQPSARLVGPSYPGLVRRIRDLRRVPVATATGERRDEGIVRATALAVVATLAFAPMARDARAQASQPAAPARTILAIGAHAGDAELTSGLLLAHQRRLGDRTVILHLTLGEGGNPKLSPDAYGQQKRREAQAVAAALGAEVLFAPYKDGELPDDDATRRYVADVIRQVKPTAHSHLVVRVPRLLLGAHDGARRGVEPPPRRVIRHRSAGEAQNHRLAALTR